MSEFTLGIIGGGQLGSMLSIAAKKLKIKTVIYCNDQKAPAQNFCDEFIHAQYDDKNKIYNFAKQVDVITYEFENIPFETLNELNKLKVNKKNGLAVLDLIPLPVQHRSQPPTQSTQLSVVDLSIPIGSPWQTPMSCR